MSDSGFHPSLIIPRSGLTARHAAAASSQKSSGTKSAMSQRKPSQPRDTQRSMESIRYLRTDLDSKFTYGNLNDVTRTDPSGLRWNASGNMSFITLLGPQCM